MKNKPLIDLKKAKKFETATFAMGWFWGPDAQFGLTHGVVRTRVGYSGGAKDNPTYYDLGNHTESIQVDFDSSIISFEELLNIFWSSHTPQYKAPSRQYMSIAFYHDDDQRKIAEKTKQEYEKRINSKVYTEITPFSRFYLAENYHQKYYLQLARELMKELGDIFNNFEEFIGSTAVAHVNGYIKGYGTLESLSKEIKDLGLSEKGQDRLKQIVEGYGR